jgi:hypothetical protein
MVLRIGNELLLTTYQTAAQSEKYQDAILIQNLVFFEKAIQSRASSNLFEILSSLLSESHRKLIEAEVRYLDWMIGYEFPAFASLSTRIFGIEKRANREELSLYVRRYTVLLLLKKPCVKRYLGKMLLKSSVRLI